LNESRFDTKRFLLEAGTLVAAAVVCALVSNALAARERKLALVGHYEAARKVPERSESPVLAPPAPSPIPEPAVTSTVATPAPAPPLKTVPAKSGTGPAAVSAAKATEPVKSSATTSAASTSAAPAPPPSAADVKSRFPAHKDTPYVELHGADVATLHRAGALFLDARRSSVYAEGHIAGARSVSVWEADVDERVGALLAEGGHERAPVVIYCSGGDCEDSHMLAQKLFGAGFENLYVYRDGWPDWQKRSLPARTGPNP